MSVTRLKLRDESLWRAALIGFAALMPLGIGSADEPATKPSQANVVDQSLEQLIDQLGDPDPAVREQAVRGLQNAGARARAALQAAAEGDNPEIAARAKKLLKTVPKEDTRKPEVDEDQPEIFRYRTSSYEGKKNLISQLADAPEGINALARLWTVETDKELKAAIFENFLKDPTHAASALLSEGNVATVELLLNAALDRKISDAPRAYAAYWLGVGKLDEAIRQWSARGGQPGQQAADEYVSHVLACLYRAKSDVANATAQVRLADAPDALQDTLIWAGDWAGLSGELHHDGVGPRTLMDLNFALGVDSLLGDRKLIEADIAAIKGAAHSREEVEFASRALLLANRPVDAEKLLISASHLSTAYEIMIERGATAAGADLLKQHDADMLPEAIELRAAAALELARLGEEKQCLEMIDRVLSEVGPLHLCRVLTCIAEAERMLGKSDSAWKHFADAVEAASTDPSRQQLAYCLPRAFPKQTNVEWAQIYAAAMQNRTRTPRALFERMRSVYDEKMSDAELNQVLASVDLSSPQNHPYVSLAIETANRWRRRGKEEDARLLLKQLASNGPGAEMFIHLGDWAAEKKDWVEATRQYNKGWRNDRSSALAMYLEGWALEQGGHVAEGRERMRLAGLLPVGDQKIRGELISGLALRGLELQAVRQSSMLIRTGTFTDYTVGSSIEESLRTAAEYSEQHNDFASAQGLWQRSTIEFYLGTLGYRHPVGNLYLADAVRRDRARELAAAGDMDGAMKQVEASLQIMPSNSMIAIDLIPDLEKLGRQKEADALYARAADLQEALCQKHPRSSHLCNEFAWLAAKCHRDLDKALERAEIAVKLDPENPAPLDTLAEVYFQRGDAAKAAELERKCVEWSPESLVHRQQLRRFEAVLK